MSSAEPLQGASAALDGGLASSPKSKREPRPARTRIVRRALHGVLLLDKPLGMSSNDALQKAKWLHRFRTKFRAYRRRTCLSSYQI